MTISADWILHYSWGGTGAYAQTQLTFTGNHTFTGSYTGNWRQQNGTVMLSFDGGPAKYGGTVNGNVGSGVMSTFSGLDGAWYLSKVGTTGILPDAAMVEGAAQPAAADGSALDSTPATQVAPTHAARDEVLAAPAGARAGRSTAKAGNGKRK